MVQLDAIQNLLAGKTIDVDLNSASQKFLKCFSRFLPMDLRSCCIGKNYDSLIKSITQENYEGANRVEGVRIDMLDDRIDRSGNEGGGIFSNMKVSSRNLILSDDLFFDEF